MAQHLQQTALIGFALLMAAAAFEDFRRLIIPNLLTLGLCILWPFYGAVGASLVAALEAVGCALVVFVVGALLFSRGYLGGGDVKLLSAATLWAGPAATPALIMVTGLLGGVLALFLLMPFGAQITAAARAMLSRAVFGGAAAPVIDAVSPPVPYGMAIAASALIVVIPPHFS